MEGNPCDISCYSKAGEHESGEPSGRMSQDANDAFEQFVEFALLQFSKERGCCITSLRSSSIKLVDHRRRKELRYAIPSQPT